jgi:hypothetical protein
MPKCARVVERLLPLAERATKLTGKSSANRTLLDDRARTRANLPRSTVASPTCRPNASRSLLGRVVRRSSRPPRTAAADLRASELAAVAADSDLAAAVDALEAAERARADPAQRTKAISSS